MVSSPSCTSPNDSVRSAHPLWYDAAALGDKPFTHDDSNKPPRELLVDIAEMLGEVPGSGCCSSATTAPCFPG